MTLFFVLEKEKYVSSEKQNLEFNTKYNFNNLIVLSKLTIQVNTHFWM